MKMKTSRKWYILLEAGLAAVIIILAFVMIWGKEGKEPRKVSVIIQNSDDTQWSAFRYGLKMAAEDQGMEMFVVSTGGLLTAEEEQSLIEWEITHGADGIIVQPVPGTEEILKRIGKKVPVMLIEHTASGDWESSPLPITEPDNYAMGQVLAEELLKDYNGKIEGKTLGILSETETSETVLNREKGFRDGIEGSGSEIIWSVSDSFAETGENSLETQPGVDIVIALDDNSLTAAGGQSAANNLHGALIYGIGNSTEAVYYLDTGTVECLVVPDEFNVGYQSFTEAAKDISHYFHKMQDITVSHTVIRRDALFSKENQEILFTMSQ